MRWATLWPSVIGLVTIACKTTGGAALQSGQGQAAAAASGLSGEQAVYSKPHFGLYFYGPGDQSAVAVPGQPNPYFDPTKPTLVFFQGWGPGELKKTKPRTFNLSRDYPHGPNADLVKVWTDRGWNFAFLDWAQFADTEFDTNKIGLVPGAKTYDNAERKIWARDDQNQLIYHLSDGTAVNVPDASVADLLANSYYQFMSRANYTGADVRFYGHSLGTQLALVVASKVAQMGPSPQDLNPAILPGRVSLTDITSSNCPHPWLPASSTHQRQPSLVCPDSRVTGDWVGERLLSLVQELKAAPKPAVIDAYRCWLLSSSGLGGDAVEPVIKQVAFAQMKPDVRIADLNEKHAFCLWNYLYSYNFPPPQVLGSGAQGPKTTVDTGADAVTCADFDADQRLNPILGGLSASTDDTVVRQIMDGNLQFIQTPASVGPTPATNAFTCQPR